MNPHFLQNKHWTPQFSIEYLLPWGLSFFYVSPPIFTPLIPSGPHPQCSVLFHTSVIPFAAWQTHSLSFSSKAAPLGSLWILLGSEDSQPPHHHSTVIISVYLSLFLPPVTLHCQTTFTCRPWEPNFPNAWCQLRIGPWIYCLPPTLNFLCTGFPGPWPTVFDILAFFFSYWCQFGNQVLDWLLVTKLAGHRMLPQGIVSALLQSRP
jgi:hypothetical protein